ncbi:S-adenosyl-L-methionine-dependent methyltransferase [Aspergillus novofumigatus IBT 16806]|uniref:S-adenosyl-L-methionine-dependent methyltransferase n=1 Tax=Aspergillus novofumigatus (strain IBT 16806) TaxID=1392255 RepID=A0A2I1CJD5_ASPN1|nr:S-adenosyl-L-methionine-dependent methyltransferase [Aspergillus novofumigatus IBT 16806]PKX97732.1 S-adenosyl-L-methionine-dependent methyltransferase [Aspergillus novofumigatus IBT 16806]
MDPEVFQLISKLSRSGQALEEQIAVDPSSSDARQTRRQLLYTARRLANYLQNEGQIVEGYLYGVIDVLLFKIGVDLGLFQKLVDSEKPLSLKDLATATGADEVLLARIMRGLTSIDAVDETDVEVYAPNKVTRAFTTVKATSGLDLFHNVIHAGWNMFPKHIKETQYKNPVDPAAIPFNKQFNGEAYFDWLGRHPALLHSFHQFMTTQRVGHVQWLDFYPIEEQLLPGFDYSDDPNAVLLVDVGGSVGHEIQAVKKRYPKIPGRMVLQDRPATIERVKPENGMEVMAHDFFTEQPIKGARAYYFRSVLHDWDDDRCRVILGHIKDAMKPGYSRILINEFSIPLRGACTFATHSDFFVMSVNAAVERTEKQWYDLIESVGLKIDRIWTLEPDSESILEVSIPE